MPRLLFPCLLGVAQLALHTLAASEPPPAPPAPDNPYLAVVAAWEALPAAVRDVASGQETGSGEELRDMPQRLAAIWAQLDAIPAKADTLLTWTSEAEPLGRGGFALRGLARARLQAAQTPAERLAAIQGTQRIARALHTHPLLIGRLVALGTEGTGLRALAAHAAEIDATAASTLLAGMSATLAETDLAALLHADAETFVEGPLARLRAWREGQLGEAVARDWTLDYEVTALGHGAGGDIFVGLRERGSGHSFQVWRSAPAEGFEIRSVDVPHDRATVARDGVEAEMRLSDRRWLGLALPLPTDDLKAIIGPLDLGLTFATDRELQAFLETARQDLAWLEEFFARQPAGPLSAPARAEAEAWSKGTGIIREQTSSYLRVWGTFYRSRLQREATAVLLRQRRAGEAWTGERTRAQLAALGAETSVQPGRLRLTFPAAPESQLREESLDFALGEGD